MHREVKQTRINDDQSRFEVTITGTPCQPNTQMSRFHAIEILSALATVPGLADCGITPFQSLKMQHDGEKWVVVLEANGP